MGSVPYTVDEKHMQDKYFTSQRASEITGCSLRQLQYWREQGVIVPTVSAEGKGRSNYYSYQDLICLSMMNHLLSIGLTDRVCQQVIKTFLMQGYQLPLHKGIDETRFLVAKRTQRDWRAPIDIVLIPFNRDWIEGAIERGDPVLPLWIDVLQDQLSEKVQNSRYRQ